MVRSRLVVLALMAIVLAGFAVGLRGSVHFTAPPEHTRFVPLSNLEYPGAVTIWSAGQPWIGGWVRNLTDDDCPDIVIWATWTIHDGNAQGGYVYAGGVRAHQTIAWGGSLTDPLKGPVHLRGKPTPDLFECDWHA